MSRVSEGSSIHAIQYSIAKTKEKLEDLQLRGSNLKQVQRPSDDPVGNMEILSIRSKSIDNDQYKRNNQCHTHEWLSPSFQRKPDDKF